MHFFENCSPLFPIRFFFSQKIFKNYFPSRCQGTIHGLNNDGVVANEISTNGQLQQGRLPIHREFGGAITSLDQNILVLYLGWKLEISGLKLLKCQRLVGSYMYMYIYIYIHIKMVGKHQIIRNEAYQVSTGKVTSIIKGYRLLLRRSKLWVVFLTWSTRRVRFFKKKTAASQTTFGLWDHTCLVMWAVYESMKQRTWMIKQNINIPAPFLPNSPEETNRPMTSFSFSEDFYTTATRALASSHRCSRWTLVVPFQHQRGRCQKCWCVDRPKQCRNLEDSASYLQLEDSSGVDFYKQRALLTLPENTSPLKSYQPRKGNSYSFPSMFMGEGSTLGLLGKPLGNAVDNIFCYGPCLWDPIIPYEYM